MAEFTLEDAARALHVKPDAVAETGTRFRRPWMRTTDGVEYVIDDGTLMVLSKPLSEAERIDGRTEPNYDGLAVPRFVPAPDDVDAEEESAAAEADEPVPAGNMDVVLAWVGDDPARAEAAREAEREGKGRTTLIEALDKITAEPTGEPADTSTNTPEEGDPDAS